MSRATLPTLLAAALLAACAPRARPAGGAPSPARPPADRVSAATDRYTRWLFSGATDSLWVRLSERGRRRWPAPDSLAAFRRQIVAVVTGFDGAVRDSVERTDTLVTVTRYGVNARDGATYYVRVRLTPADSRISGICAQDAGVAAATPYLAYRTRTPLRLPVADEWIVFWGGRTVAQNYHAAYPGQRFALDLIAAEDSAAFARALRGRRRGSPISPASAVRCSRRRPGSWSPPSTPCPTIPRASCPRTTGRAITW